MLIARPSTDMGTCCKAMAAIPHNTRPSFDDFCMAVAAIETASVAIRMGLAPLMLLTIGFLLL